MNTLYSLHVGMQQQVQKAMAKKKAQEKQNELIPEVRINYCSRDNTTNNNEKSKQTKHTHTHKLFTVIHSRCMNFDRNLTKYTIGILLAVYRGHTIRMKRWLPEIEQKIKYAFDVIKNENEAVQYLLNLGLTTHEIDLVLQHFLTNAELNMRKQDQRMEKQPRKPLTVQEQQLELIGFSQSVRLLF